MPSTCKRLIFSLRTAAVPEEVYVDVHIWLHISVDMKLSVPNRARNAGTFSVRPMALIFWAPMLLLRALTLLIRTLTLLIRALTVLFRALMLLFRTLKLLLRLLVPLLTLWWEVKVLWKGVVKLSCGGVEEGGGRMVHWDC